MFRILQTEEDKEAFDVKTTPEQLNELCKLIEGGKVQNNLAKSTLDKMLESGKPCTEYISEEDMAGLDDSFVDDLCRQAIEANPKAVEQYKQGKEKAIMACMGYVMKNSKGKANAQDVLEKIKSMIS